MKQQSLDYIIEQGLHDAVLNKCTVDYISKTVSFDIQTEAEIVHLRLINVTCLKMDMEDDFKNREIILDCDVLNSNELKIFTTSNTSYRIHFENSEVRIEKSP
jgi:hypothetical protein